MGRIKNLPILHEAPSLSKSALLLSPCIRWAGPQARHYNEDLVDATDNIKRDQGTRFHTVLDRTNKGLVSDVHNDILLKVQHACRYLTELGERCDSLDSETAIGIYWATGHAIELPGVKDRKYPNLPGWMYGTADLVGVLKTGELYVADWKTGGTDGAKEQLMSLAYGLWVVGGSVGAVVISCLQVNEEGVWAHETPVSRQELDAHADAMRFQWEDIGKRNDPVPGVHCTALYCPHLAYCPAVTEVVVQSAALEEKTSEKQLIINGQGHKLTDNPGSNAEAGFVMANVSAAERQLKYWKLAMTKYIENGGRVTYGQYEWGPGPNGRRWRKQ